jgi:hypothetical protein
MLKLIVIALVTFVAAPLTFAQVPPPPPQGDFPNPMPPEGKKNSGKKAKEVVQPERKGVKPPLPVTPPTPEPTAPDQPDIE